MRSPYTVEKVGNEWQLSRTDGKSFGGDFLPWLSVNYLTEEAAIAALQRYSREYYREMGAI